VAGKYQPRRDFNIESLEELANSINQNGVIAPLTVRNTSNNNYEVIAGERRWRATIIAGLKEIPCIIKDVNDKDSALMSLIENIHRESLSPLEEAEHIQNTILEFNLSKAEVARKIGKSRSWVSNLIRLTDVTNSVKDMLRNNEIDATHARALLSLDNHKQYLVAKDIVQKGLTVSETEKLVKSLNEKTASNNHKTKDADLASIEETISEKYNAPVSLKLNKEGGGTLEFTYFSQEELVGIIQKIKN
jgi:ParB family chromosome partitioning protein